MPHFPEILPCLNDYLRVRTTSTEPTAGTRPFTRVDASRAYVCISTPSDEAADPAKAKRSRRSEEKPKMIEKLDPVLRIQFRIIRLLGRIGGILSA